MKDKVAEFRWFAEKRREEGTSARYPDAMKRIALTHAQERVRAGASVQRVAKELGLAGQTLTYWLRTRSTLVGAEGSGPKLIPVITRPAPSAMKHSAVMVTMVVVAGDVRVEVRDVATAVELVRRLR